MDIPGFYKILNKYLGALQGAAVISAELGEYARAASFLEDLIKVGFILDSEYGIFSLMLVLGDMIIIVYSLYRRSQMILTFSACLGRSSINLKIIVGVLRHTRVPQWLVFSNN